jgi:hypothetical protein
MATKHEKQYMDIIAQQPCVLCGAHGVELHHLREGQGMSQRASNYMVIPLCPSCHRGSSGLHGNRALLKIQKVEELDLLARTIETFAQRINA